MATALNMFYELLINFLSTPFLKSWIRQCISTFGAIITVVCSKCKIAQAAWAIVAIPVPFRVLLTSNDPKLAAKGLYGSQSSDHKCLQQQPEQGRI